MSLILDPVFGPGGFVAIPFPNQNYLPTNQGRALALQRNMRIVVAGQCDPTLDLSGFVVARYKAVGMLDTSFGPGGSVGIDFGSYDLGNALVLRKDGKLIVAGHSAVSGGVNSNQFALARYLPSGILDANFGTKGVVTSVFSDPNEISSIQGLALQADGKIVAAGYYYPPGLNIRRFALARYLPDGDPDLKFGQNGHVLAEFLPGHDAEAFAVAIQPSGRIVAVGKAKVGAQSLVALAGYMPSDGSPDLSFGSGGLVLTSIGGFGWSEGRAIAVDGVGNLIVAGTVTVAPGVKHMAVVRYLSPTGQKDPSFGSGGIAFSSPALPGNCEANAVGVLKNGAVFAAGSFSSFAQPWISHFAVTGFLNNGKLDLSIGSIWPLANSGTVVTQIGLNSGIRALAVQPDEKKVIVAGFTYFLRRLSSP